MQLFSFWTVQTAGAMKQNVYLASNMATRLCAAFCIIWCISRSWYYSCHDARPTHRCAEGQSGCSQPIKLWPSLKTNFAVGSKQIWMTLFQIANILMRPASQGSANLEGLSSQCLLNKDILELSKKQLNVQTQQMSTWLAKYCDNA